MRRRVLLFALAAAFTSLTASAALLLRLTDAELVQHSDRVVAVTVTGTSVSWLDPDGDGVSQIWTTVNVRVDQVVKGNVLPGDTFAILQMGGKIGDVEYRIPGIPKFAQGDRALVCLLPNLANPHYSPIVGLAQGHWIITTDAQGTEMARRDFSDSCFAKQEEGRFVEDAKPSEAAEPLADVVARLAAEVK